MRSFRLVIGLLLTWFTTFSNNLRFENGVVDGNFISVDISWDNSWNLTLDGGSHDAVWIFAKGKSPNGLWNHIDLMPHSHLHNVQNPLTIDAVDDGKGVFVYSQNHGIYSIPSTSISVLASSNLTDFTQVKIFGIEMVYIPQGEFYLGDGASISSFGDSEGNPILINSEASIDGNSLALVNPNEEFAPEPLPEEIPKNFPKGYKPFYVMKYEISQTQYVDFLNTLTFVQQSSRTAISPSLAAGSFAMVNPNQPDSLYRNGIVIISSGSSTGIPAVYGMDGNRNGVFNEDDDGFHRAANFLNWGDLSAYLDWAALRPITEMEFEKISRGSNQNPISGEFAWGTSQVTNANNPINDGTVFEVVVDVLSDGSGLANYGNVIAIDGWGLRGVLRTGFAATQESKRLQAGASFYGVMELSGNVWEQTVMIGEGCIEFSGIHGDGILTDDGDSNQQFWCNPNTAFGVSLKGGGWASTISDVGSWRDLAVSDRFYSHINPTSRRNSVGGRGAR